ncbi:hypothetical protein [Halalkalicoccus subterraneus]|uniref:hypothetical protein n=1 Tax=Halalkalicoccus subterraneus TaxID=2675002 RepID=UPI001FE85C03|nr:hypothetical protein [Halalkalicoccus subterraneus]
MSDKELNYDFESVETESSIRESKGVEENDKLGKALDEEEKVRVTIEVPESVRDGAKSKLPHGGMSDEVRGLLTRIAFGQEMNQRSRLEQQLDDLREERSKLQRERRELDAKIENLDDRIHGVEDKLGSITTQEDRYEAKLEELEYRIRVEGTRVFPEHGAVERVASGVGKNPEGVIKDLKQRNPDVNDSAFEEGSIHGNGGSFLAPDEDGEITPVDEREQIHRSNESDD